MDNSFPYDVSSSYSYPREGRRREYNHFIPFGDERAVNVLDFFLGTPDMINNVKKNSLLSYF